jgi:hypothetical protein
MTTTIKKTTSKYLRVLAITTLLSISCGAHALCVNPDGSLDDRSMNTASIDREMLPACEIPQPTPTEATQPRAAKTQGSATKPIDDHMKPLKNVKRPDLSARVLGDCRTANGESREGTLGAVDLLPACGA